MNVLNVNKTWPIVSWVHLNASFYLFFIMLGIIINLYNTTI